LIDAGVDGGARADHNWFGWEVPGGIRLLRWFVTPQDRPFTDLVARVCAEVHASKKFYWGLKPSGAIL